MNILQVNNHHRILGGSESVYFNTSKLLTDAGHGVVPFAAASDQDLPSPFAKYFPDGLDGQMAKLRDLPRYIRNRDAARAVERVINEVGPFQVAHLHIYYGRLTAAILPQFKRRGIPVVQTLHEYKLACPIYTMERAGLVCEDCVQGGTLNVIRHRCKGGSLLKSAAVLAEFWGGRLQGDVRLIDKFICVSDFQRALMERAGIAPEKLVTLHNFVSIDDFNPVKQTDKGDYLLYFGRIEKAKGVPTLVRAAKTMRIPLKLAGTGAWSEEMGAQIADAPWIEALGFVSGQPLQDLIARARAVVVPSEWYENCPMAILEAKASGTPVIGARIGGIPELVREGEDGFLFEPGDVEGLAGAIKSLISADAGRLALNARLDVRARFAPEAHLKKLMAIYGDVV